MARRYLARAKNELASGDHDRLRYAALEIRFTMEAITYDRAQAYRAEIPPTEYSTWQPRQLLELLSEIDPHAALTSTISFGQEKTLGQTSTEMTLAGTDVVLTIGDLKKQYNAIGSHLHPPTLDKIDAPSAHDPARLRKRCEACISILNKVLSSPVWNFTVGRFSTMPCQRCGKPVRRRLHPEAKAVEADCFECRAAYTIEQIDDSVIWKPQVEKLPCPTDGCAATLIIWQDEIKPGTFWTCHRCGKAYKLALGIVLKDAP